MKKLYAKHFEILFPDRVSHAQFYMLSRYIKAHSNITLTQSRFARFRKPVTYIYLEDAMSLAKQKLKDAKLPRIETAWKKMISRLDYIDNNYITLYEKTVEAKIHKYKPPSDYFIQRRNQYYTLKQLRQQEFLKKWRENYDKIFRL